jgi:hypothetical protein
MKQLGVSAVDQGGGKRRSVTATLQAKRTVAAVLHLRIIGTQRGAICRHNCRPSKRAQFGENQNCLMWKGIVWSEWQDLNLRPPRPERGGAQHD